MELFALFAAAALLLLVAKDIQRAQMPYSPHDDARTYEVYMALSKSLPALYRMNATQVLELRYGNNRTSTVSGNETCGAVSERNAAWCARKGLIDEMIACGGPPVQYKEGTRCYALLERILVFMNKKI